MQEITVVMLIERALKKHDEILTLNKEWTVEQQFLLGAHIWDDENNNWLKWR